MEKYESGIDALAQNKSEIDDALAQARERLAIAPAQADASETLRYACDDIRHAAGMLSAFGFDGLSTYANAITDLLVSVFDEKDTTGEAAIALADRGIAALSAHIAELLTGKLNQPLRLYPIYREMGIARGAAEPSPADLFFPDLSRAPMSDAIEELDKQSAATVASAQRRQYEKGLLGWLVRPGDSEGPQLMLQAVRKMARIHGTPAAHSLWWIAIAFFEGLASGAIALDPLTARVCRRVDTYMRACVEDPQITSPDLMRELLYQIAAADIDTAHAHAVHDFYRLDGTLDVPLTPALRQALDTAHDAWSRFCSGEAFALMQFEESLSAVTAQTLPLHNHDIDGLLADVAGILQRLRDDPLHHADGVADIVAASLHLVERIVASAIPYSASWHRRIAHVRRRLAM